MKKMFRRWRIAVSCCVLFTTIPLWALTLPFETGFESGDGYQTGTLNQAPWSIDAGSVNVSNTGAFEGAQLLTLQSAVPYSKLTLLPEEPLIEEILFIDLYLKPTASTLSEIARQSNSHVAGFTGLVKVGSDGEIYTASGGVGGAVNWAGTNQTFDLADDQASDWIRHTYRLNYSNKTWDLYLNDTLVAADLSFIDQTLESFSVFSVKGQGLLDLFSIGATHPLFIDDDNDGISDTYELAHGLDSEENDRNGDLDHDGILNIQEIIRNLAVDNPDTDEDGIPDGIDADPMTVDTLTLSSLPFTEGFENIADLENYNNWTVEGTPLPEIETTVVQGGTQSLKVTGGNEPVILSNLFDGKETDPLWADFYVQPQFYNGTLPQLAKGSAIGFYFDPTGQLKVFNGTNHSWINAGTPVTENQWQHLTVRLDYAQQTWSLWLNSLRIAQNLGFANPSPYFFHLRLHNYGSQPAYFDDINFSDVAPAHLDSDGDGITDAIEAQYGLNPDDSADANGDSDGDGIFNVIEISQSTNPQDFFNDDTPALAKISGDEQEGFAGMYLLQPLVIEVRNSENELLTNAPVRFLVENGGGYLALTPTEGINTTTVSIRTDLQGRAKIYYLQSSTENVESEIVALIDSQIYSINAEFTSATLESPLPVSGLKLWLNAEEGVEVVENKVTNWNDQSGFQNNAFQSFVHSKPIITSNAINGHAAVTFDGLEDHLILGSNYLYSQKDGVTCFAVLNSTEDRAVPLFFDFGSYNSQHYGFTFDSNTVGISSSIDHGGLSNSLTGNHTIGSGNYALYTGEILFGDKQQVRLNGGDPIFQFPVSLSKLTSAEIFTNSIRVGSRGPVTIGSQAKMGDQQNSNLKGSIAELLVYDRALSSTEREQVENYLKNKYSLGSPSEEITVASSIATAEEEGEVAGKFTVSRTGSTAQPVVVNYLVNGSALKNLDYKPLSGWVKIPAGAASADIIIKPKDDSDFEGNETVEITLMGNEKYNVGTSSTASVTIEDNETTPEIPDQGLKLWLRADAGVSKDIRRNVSAWADYSGEENDATQAQELKPQWVENVINGRPVLRFNSDSQHLSLQENYLLSENDGVTVFAILSSSTNKETPVFFDFGNAYTKNYGFSYDTNTLGISTPTNHGGVNDVEFGQHTAKEGLFQLYTGEIVFGEEQRVRLFGEEAFATAITTSQLTTAEIAASATRSSAGGPVVIGAQSKTGSWGAGFRGDIAEIIYYDRLLSSSEREQVEQYLAQKYNVYRDSDGDGLNDNEESLLGTNANSVDSDGDGITDYDEVRVYFTNPLVNGTEEQEPASTVSGSVAANPVGNWVVDGSSIYLEGGRGAVEYTVNLAENDVYQIEVEGQGWWEREAIANYSILVYVDGTFLRKVQFTGFDGETAIARVITPWLEAGNHTVKIFWDNVSGDAALQIDEVRVLPLAGEDTDEDGIKDWIEDQAAEANDADVVPLTSPTSPVCIEGKSRFISMMNIASSAEPNEEIPVQHGAGERWYSNVPLSSTGATDIDISYENGVVEAEETVTWSVTNVLDNEDIVIRKGDSLLFNAVPNGATSGDVVIDVGTEEDYETTYDAPVVHKFEEGGVYEITGTYTGSEVEAETITVTVIDASFGGDVAGLIGSTRKWNCPNLPEGIVVEHDPSVNLFELPPSSSGARSFNLMIPFEGSEYVVGRISENGPIVCSARVFGLTLATTNSYMEVIETLSDGSQIIEMGIVVNEPYEGMSIKLDIFAGGVMFEDGTLFTELNFSDFNELGQSSIRFIKPADAEATCHHVGIYDGATFLGGY